MIRVGIAGGAGYVAGELLRLLAHHPHVEVAFIYSHSQVAGTAVSTVHRDLFFRQGWTFTNQVSTEVDVVFLCLGHGQSRAFLQQHPFPKQVSVIDLGSDFRLSTDAVFEGRRFQYGLPELGLGVSGNVANPGCFATAIELALLPLAAKKLLNQEIYVHAITGSTGAGAGLTEYSHFSRRVNNLSIYKPFTHQHLDEIRESLQSAGQLSVPDIHFIPVKGDFPRGIFASLHMATRLSQKQAFQLFYTYYDGNPFVHVTEEAIELKQVINTNHCLIQVEVIAGRLLLTSIIDNLLKGAAGQAIHNMNKIFGLPEVTGLQIKPIAF